MIEKQVEKKISYDEYEKYMADVDLNSDNRLNLCEYLNRC